MFVHNKTVSQCLFLFICIMAVVAENVVVEDQVLAVPLGWPAKVSCPKKIIEIVGTKNVTDLSWVKYESHEDKASAKPNEKSSTYIIPKILSSHEGDVYECILKTSTASNLVGRTKLKVQDCSIDPFDEKSYNLRDPCAYGKCKTANEQLLCICFTQYTGIYCEELKPFGFFWELIPFVVPFLALSTGFFIVFINSFVTKNRKKKQTMCIKNHVLVQHCSQLNASELFRPTQVLRKFVPNSNTVTKDEPIVKKTESKTKNKIILTKKEDKSSQQESSNGPPSPKRQMPCQKLKNAPSTSTLSKNKSSDVVGTWKQEHLKVNSTQSDRN